MYTYTVYGLQFRLRTLLLLDLLLLTLIDLNPVEYNQGCNGSCNTLGDSNARICVGNKTEDVDLNVFNMITKIHESKILTRHISCKCHGCMKCNSNQKWNNDKCSNLRKHQAYKNNVCEKDCIWNPSTCTCEKGKYLVNNIDYSLITCYEITEATKIFPAKIISITAVLTKTISTNFN